MLFRLNLQPNELAADSEVSGDVVVRVERTLRLKSGMTLQYYNYKPTPALVLLPLHSGSFTHALDSFDSLRNVMM